MGPNNSIDENKLPTNRPIYLNQGKINLPDVFVEKFKDYFSDDKLSKLLASFPSVNNDYIWRFFEARCSCIKIEEYEALSGEDCKADLDVAEKKLGLLEYWVNGFCYCNNLRKLFLDYKKVVENLIRAGSNAKNIREIVKLEKEIDEKVGEEKFIMCDKVGKLDLKYYGSFSENYQFLGENVEEYQNILNNIKWDIEDFCTKIYSYILVYKEIKDAYLYIEYLIIMPSICQLLENFSFENNVKGLLTE